MEDTFIKILNMSITASYFVVALIILRAVFRKIPKWISCALWGLVGLRLILPFSFESILSLIPSSQAIPPDIAMSKNPQISSGVPVFNSVVNPIISEAFTPDPSYSVNPLQVVSFIASVLWLTGIAAMLIYAVISFILIKRKTRESIKNADGTYICDTIGSPFILGVIKPAIFIPSLVAEADKQHIIAHEKAHIKRLDHLWKPLGFLLLSVYWFNPLMWLAYIFLCRDIEAACDERVLKNGGAELKKSYSEALINCSAPKRIVAACPLAFGETGVKQRIKNVLSYKKPALWIVIIALIVSIILSVCFMTNPKEMKIDDIPGYEHIFKDVDKLQFFTGENRVYTTMDPAQELRGLRKARIAKAGEVYFDYAYKIEINDRFLICIDNEFTLFTVMDNLYLNKVTADTTDSALKPIPTSAVYGFKNPEVFKDFFLDSTDNTVLMNQDDIDGFTHYSGIYVTLDSITFGADNLVSFNVTWHNETNKTVNFGEMFRIELIDGRNYIDITPKDATWYAIAYILKPETTLSHTYCVMGLDMTKNATYRFSTSFSIEDGRNYSGDCGFSFNNTYASSIGGTSGTSAIEISKELTLDDVTELSKKGKDLSWADFENFSYIVTGSGLYIRLYKIDERFSLAIGGSGADSKPMYIYLSTESDYIDIRGDDVNEFIEKYKDSPLPVPRLGFAKREFPVDSTGKTLNEFIKYGAYLPLFNYDRMKACPTVRIDSLDKLQQFYDHFEGKTDVNMSFRDTEFRFSEIQALYSQGENSDFFTDNSLLITYVSASDENNRFAVISLQKYDEAIHINIRENAYTPDDKSVPTGWLLVTEVKKSDLSGITRIEAYVNETVSFPEPTITHIYYQKTDNSASRGIYLYSNGTFTLAVSPYSSFIENGSFEYEGDLLILTSEDGERRYVFEVNSDSITFRRKDSVVYKLFTEDDVPDGTEFILQYP